MYIRSYVVRRAFMKDLGRTLYRQTCPRYRIFLSYFFFFHFAAVALCEERIKEKREYFVQPTKLKKIVYKIKHGYMLHFMHIRMSVFVCMCIDEAIGINKTII